MLGWIFQRIFKWGVRRALGRTVGKVLRLALRQTVRRFFPLLLPALLWPGLLLPASPGHAQEQAQSGIQQRGVQISLPNSLQNDTEPHSEITRVTPMLREGKLTIDADIDLELGSALRSAAEKGLALHFVAEVEISSTYRWWFNKTVVNERLSYRLSYNVLTRQWRVGTRDWRVPQATLDDALATLRHVRGWVIGSADTLNPDLYAKGRYEGRMRLRLDTARLSRPFQIDALNRSVWTLATPWKTFPLTPPAF